MRRALGRLWRVPSGPSSTTAVNTTCAAPAGRVSSSSSSSSSSTTATSDDGRREEEEKWKPERSSKGRMGARRGGRGSRGSMSWSGLYEGILSTLLIFDDPEERRKCGLLVGTICIFMLYNSAYILPAFLSAYASSSSSSSSIPSACNYFSSSLDHGDSVVSSLLPSSLFHSARDLILSFTSISSCPSSPPSMALPNPIIIPSVGTTTSASGSSSCSCSSFTTAPSSSPSPPPSSSSGIGGEMSVIVYADFSSSLFLFTMIEIGMLVVLYSTRYLNLIAIGFSIFVNYGAVGMCLQYGMVAEYLLMLLFIPIFLFYFYGARIGLASMAFLCAQAVGLLYFTSVSPPTLELAFTPTDRLLATLLNYMLVGCTVVVYANSHSCMLRTLQAVLLQSETSNCELQQANKVKAQFLANIVIGSCGDCMYSLINDLLDYEKMEANQLHLEVEPFSIAETMTPMAKRKQLNLEISANVTHTVRRGDATRFYQIIFNLVSNAIKFTPAGTINVAVTCSNDNKDLVRVDVKDTGIGIPSEHVSQLFEEFYLVDPSITRRHGGTGLGLAICKRLTEAMSGDIGCESTPGKGSHFWFTALLPAMELQSKDATTGKEPSDRPSDDAKAEAAAAAAAATAQAAAAAAVVRGTRILLVEDNLTNQKVGVRALTSLGCDVVLAQNGEDCLRVIAEEERGFDAILMDCQMPVMDGFEATMRIRQMEAHNKKTSGQTVDQLSSAVDENRMSGDAPEEEEEEEEEMEQMEDEVKENEEQRRKSGHAEARALWWSRRGAKRIPVIALTASVTSEYRQKCYDSGMDDWLSKPFTKSALQSVLAKWLLRDDGRTSSTTALVLPDSSGEEERRREQSAKVD